ncbi:MAG: tetraacyldisaccharide 4'-kinase [Phaeodactylibacter xiamenensis]|uniref:Tetraacyldisaccharide 4'-kinase n=1 Tax=Phaeodactylibacter xiamenensis TaxID=1524460 RepID=A0A098S6H5_9BACT|nr:tetraacyldisaccharide 4'-kinase [Phaeodactylibacter xiamenensis]KGE87745.1 tetraacyldisaccharide 4'-kinase [Phaeodactylibacter xiamenensis]MCR9055288.1 tetraacyldisaccharide 4'-kinase [bacterium]
MIQKQLVQILLAPFSLLYGIGVSVRDFLYKQGLLKGVEFNLPVISVGNLSVGGAGKSPHIEYLIRLLKDYIDIATLSRGYGRKTKGYLEVHADMTAEQAGDEPLQFKRKFPEIMVTVCESRTFAIPKIMMARPETKAILLDDAFQHRSVKPGMNILLTEYSHPFTRDYLLPAGRLREWRSAYERADIIIVSKCPPQLSEEERQAFTAEISPLPHQKLYFSYYDYGQPYFILNPRYRLEFTPELEVLLISAIARTDYLQAYLEEQVEHIKAMEYEDHHYFTKYDVGQLKANFDRMETNRKVILTTEKDAMRLQLHHQYIKEHQLPVFALPVQVRFHFGQAADFDETIQQYLLNFQV